MHDRIPTKNILQLEVGDNHILASSIHKTCTCVLKINFDLLAFCKLVFKIRPSFLTSLIIKLSSNTLQFDVAAVNWSYMRNNMEVFRNRRCISKLNSLTFVCNAKS